MHSTSTVKNGRHAPECVMGVPLIPPADDHAHTIDINPTSKRSTPAAVGKNNQYSSGDDCQSPATGDSAMCGREDLYFLLALVIMGAFTGGIFFGLVKFFNSPEPLRLKVEMESLEASPLSVTNAEITAGWNLTFAVKNPSCGDLDHDRVEIRVYHDEEFLSGTSVGPFYVHGPSHWLLLDATIAASTRNVSDSAADAIAAQLRNGILLSLNVELRSNVVGQHSYMTAQCRNISVGLSTGETGWTMPGGPQECKVDFLHW